MKNTAATVLAELEIDTSKRIARLITLMIDAGVEVSQHEENRIFAAFNEAFILLRAPMERKAGA